MIFKEQSTITMLLPHFMTIVVNPKTFQAISIASFFNFLKFARQLKDIPTTPTLTINVWKTNVNKIEIIQFIYIQNLSNDHVSLMHYVLRSFRFHIGIQLGKMNFAFVWSKMGTFQESISSAKLPACPWGLLNMSIALKRAFKEALYISFYFKGH